MSPFPPLINHVTRLGRGVWPVHPSPAPLAAFHFVRPLIRAHARAQTH